MLHFLNSGLVTNILIKLEAQNLLVRNTHYIVFGKRKAIFLEATGNVHAHLPSDSPSHKMKYQPY